MSEPPVKDGLFISLDHVPFAIINGSMYELEKNETMSQLAPGYYDDELNLVESIKQPIEG